MLSISSEAAIRGVLYKKLFLEILQNPQENTCARTRVSFLIKLQAGILIDSNVIWTHNHLVRKRTLNHLAKLLSF